MKALSAAAALALLASPTLASEPHGRLLMRLCASPTAACESFVLGEVDGLNAGTALSHGKATFCLPERAGPREKIAVVHQYLVTHPETMSIDAGEAVARALAASYPCHHV
jgi:hypothetical protein